MTTFAPAMHRIKHKLRHLFSRMSRISHRNGYGVHSPFAYGFIQDVIYESTPYYAYPRLRAMRRQHSRAEQGLTSKCDRLMFRIANFCRPRHAVLIGPRTAVTAEYIAAGSTSTKVSLCNDTAHLPAQESEFVYASPGTDFLAAFLAAAEHCSNSTFFAAASIHKTRENKCKWQQICQDPRAIVTFDLYEIGLVFFNKDLNKQNYKVSF